MGNPETTVALPGAPEAPDATSVSGERPRSPLADDNDATLPADGPTSSALAVSLSAVAAADRPPPLAVFGPGLRYQASEVVGSGGIGQVLRARDADIDRTVALKRLHAESRGAENVARFAEEVRTLGALEHPNIVPIHDVGVDAKGPFLVMKYVDGQTLEDVIDKLRAGDAKAHAYFTFERRVEIFTGILEAVAYAHARGVLHRDIKPANVMIGRFGEVTVMDWGLAKTRAEAASTALPEGAAKTTSSPRLTHVGALLGTPAYMSPEQARGEPLTEKSDIYSLCVLFYELLTLEHYLADCTTIAAALRGVETRSPAHPSNHASAHQPIVPMDLGYFVLDGLAKDPAARHGSVSDMLARLASRAEGLIKVSCSATFLMRAASTLSRAVTRYPHAALRITVAAVFLVAAMAAYLAVRSLHA